MPPLALRLARAIEATLRPIHGHAGCAWCPARPGRSRCSGRASGAEGWPHV